MGIRDFVDIVYSYSINSPEMRNDFRTALHGYIFDIQKEPEADMTFEGFKNQSMSLLDELDAFNQ